ncbi:hypothetical protein BH10ACT7_BH10ACT7_21990 [soil metagenome]
MFTARRATAIALPAVLIFTLGGCALLDTNGDEDVLTGIAACALGHTWTLDLAGLAEQVKADLEKNGIVVQNVVGSGEQTLDWSVEGHVALDSNYELTITSAPAADQVLTVVETHAGTITGAAYINGEVAIPRKWDDSKYTLDTTAENNGAEVAIADIGYVIPPTTFDDSVGLELTCNGNELTIHPRGSTITQTWSKD